MVPHIISGTTITFYKGANPYSITTSHKNYEKIKAGLKTSPIEELVRFADCSETIKTYLKTDYSGNVKLGSGVVYYKGKRIHNYLTETIIKLAASNFAVDNLLAFCENLYENSSNKVLNTLYKFLEFRGFPITVDGCFLGYKAVQSDFKDKYTKTIDNSIGKTVEMPRNEVSEDEEECSGAGLYVGTLEYAFGYADQNDHIILVKVNPRDVVVVPKKEPQKLRCCKYTVVELYNKNLDKAKGQPEVIKEPSKVMPGDTISFNYYCTKARKDKTRYLSVIDTIDGDITGRLLKPESHSGEIRRFKFDKMKDIKHYGTTGN